MISVDGKGIKVTGHETEFLAEQGGRNVSDCNNELVPIFYEMQELAYKHSLMSEKSEIWIETDKQLAALYNKAASIFSRYNRTDGGYFMAMYDMRKGAKK